MVEVSGRDRPGLLAALARTLADAGLRILSAHIDSYGERAVDAFYVRTAEGGKLADGKAGNAFSARLNEVLVEEDQQTPKGRPRLQRARASVAR